MFANLDAGVADDAATSQVLVDTSLPITVVINIPGKRLAYHILNEKSVYLERLI